MMVDPALQEAARLLQRLRWNAPRDRGLLASLEAALAGLYHALGESTGLGVQLKAVDQALSAIGRAPATLMPATVREPLVQVLQSVRQILESRFLGKGEPVAPGPLNSAPVRSTGAGQWRREGLELHCPSRPVALLPLPPAQEAPAAADEDPPPPSLDELKARCAALIAGAPLFEPSAPPEPIPDPMPPPSFAQRLLRRHLTGLAASYDARAQAHATGSRRWSELEALESRLLARVDAVLWLGGDAGPLLTQALAEAADPGEAFAAALPLLALSGADGLDAVLLAMEVGTAKRLPGLGEALRLASHPGIPERLHALLDGALAPTVRAEGLRLLADRALLSETTLAKLLGDPALEVRQAAARAAVLGGARTVLPLLERALADRPVPGVQDAVRAAVLLGSDLGLGRLREWARTRPADWPGLLPLLARCGAAEDMAVFLAQARAGGPLAVEAVEALGIHGACAAMPELEALARSGADGKPWPPAEQALRRILGEAPAGGSARAARLRAGGPWYTGTLLEALGAEGSTGAERAAAFEELLVRTGHHVPFDATWPVFRQRRAAALWRDTLGPRLARFPQGAWLSRGQPAEVRSRP